MQRHVGDPLPRVDRRPVGLGGAATLTLLVTEEREEVLADVSPRAAPLSSLAPATPLPISAASAARARRRAIRSSAHGGDWVWAGGWPGAGHAEVLLSLRLSAEEGCGARQNEDMMHLRWTQASVHELRCAVIAARAMPE